MTNTDIRDRLLPGERIVWQGEPAKGLLVTGRDALLISFSLLWCGFAMFWTFGARSTGAPPFFLLWGGMFVCVGLYFVAGRFAVDAWARGRTRYAVTDRRVLIDRRAPLGKFTAISLSQLPDLDLTGRRDGRGTIRFGQAASPWGNRGVGSWTPALDATPQFIAIPDARRVFDLLQRASGA